LVWGSVTAEGRKALLDSKGFHDILSVAEICHDLADWNHPGYQALVARRQEWCNELCSGLLVGRVEAPNKLFNSTPTPLGIQVEGASDTT